jgi:hypothetical protein
MRKDEMLVIAILVTGGTLGCVFQSAMPIIAAFLGVGAIVLKDVFNLAKSEPSKKIKTKKSQ